MIVFMICLIFIFLVFSTSCFLFGFYAQSDSSRKLYFSMGMKFCQIMIVLLLALFAHFNKEECEK